jgi:hypothetical protein
MTFQDGDQITFLEVESQKGRAFEKAPSHIVRGRRKATVGLN